MNYIEKRICFLISGMLDVLPAQTVAKLCYDAEWLVRIGASPNQWENLPDNGKSLKLLADALTEILLENPTKGDARIREELNGMRKREEDKMKVLWEKEQEDG
jgi:hypothetical protein